jgi:glucosamine--fructose-6-phosphate aminotransferase (isomerizing)
MDGLKSIAYRGYDSCGIALADGERLTIAKTVGPWESLEPRSTELVDIPARSGIAHTRWATHGEPSDVNAHPHLDCNARFAIAHNGIIENYGAVRRDLIQSGHKFCSATDSEVIVHLIEQFVEDGLEVEAAVRAAAQQLVGAYAFVVLDRESPTEVYGVRHDCPLIVGRSDEGSFLTSDVAAIVDYCDEAIILDNQQMAIISQDDVVTVALTGEPVTCSSTRVDWTKGQAQRSGYPHFMLKEIHEQPDTVQQLLSARLNDRGETVFPEIDEILPANLNKIVVVACGTASYVCAYAKLVLEQMTGLPVLAEVGSEFRYRRNFLDPSTLLVAISQSGETADTIASLRLAKEAGAPTVSFVNVMGTTIARESDRVIQTLGGPEAAVPSTKVFMNQLVSALLVSIHLGRRLGSLPKSDRTATDLRTLPSAVRECLRLEGVIEKIALTYSNRDSWFVIGRGLDEPLAREAALKLKEVAYVHAESLPAGELKHGPIALVEAEMPVLAIVTQPHLRTKMANNIQEVAARRGALIVLASMSDEAIDEASTEVVMLPSISAYLDPILVSVPLQLLSYHIAVLRGASIDYPRNLAKSVTVE